jgi:hypothetical protein
MLIINPVKRIAVICAAILFISQQGCVSKAVMPPPLTQSMLNGKRIGVVIQRAPEGEGFKRPEEGVLYGMGRGAGLGLIFVGPATIPCIVSAPSICGLIVGSLSVVGAIAGGAIAGDVVSQSASTWDKAEAIFRAHLSEQNFDHLLEERLTTYATETGCSFEPINGTVASAGKPIDYESLSRKGIGVVLELSEITIQLQAAGLPTVNSPLRFFTSVRAKVIRTNDGTLLDNRIVIDDMGEIRPLDDWMLNNGIAFREQVSLAAKRTAEMIVNDLFFQPSLPDRPGGRTQSLGAFDPMPITIHGIEPISPLLFNQGDSERVSLQPTLKWETYQGDNVTYDLIIWRDWDRTELIYNREGLSEAFYTFEKPLQPDSEYAWTVRARYTSGGLTRITEWAMWSAKPGTLIKVMSLGVAYLIPEHRSYYLFRTPRSQERRWYQIWVP